MATDSIKRFVKKLNNPEQEGGIWLPKIQRPFVWNEGQITKFFDSIMRDYPIGSLLIWRTKEQNVGARPFIDNYKDNITLSDYYYDGAGIKKLVLDGQQRLQSFYIGLRGSFNRKELYIDLINSGLVDDSEDLKYKFRFIDPLSKVGANWFKLKMILQDSKKEATELVEMLTSDVENTYTTEEKLLMSKNISKIKRRFESEECISYQEIDDTLEDIDLSIDDVVEIFIRTNSGGTKLERSDLLFSLLISDWSNADRAIDELLDVINKTDYSFDRDFILKTCLVILNKGAKYDVKKFKNTDTINQIINNWDNISESIKETKDFLYNETFLKSDYALPSYLVLIPIIYFRFHYPKRWVDGNKDIKEYIIRALLTKAFSYSSDSLIDQCIKEINKTGDFKIDDIFNIIRNKGRSLEMTKETILNIGYKSREIHLLFNLWYGFNYNPASYNYMPQVDHIFPRSVLSSLQKTNPNTGREEPVYQNSDINQIANCMLLTAQENGAGGKSDMLPEDFFRDKNEEYLEKHLIPRDKNLWKLDNFLDFIEARKLLILKKFSYLLYD